MKLAWNFLGEGGVKQKTFHGGVWISSGTAHLLTDTGRNNLLSRGTSPEAGFSVSPKQRRSNAAIKSST